MNYILALIPKRFHDRAKAVIGLVGIVLTIVAALFASPGLAIVLGILTSYGIYQVPNASTLHTSPDVEPEPEQVPDSELIYDGE